MHVQDVPARYSPQMGWEGANVIFDDWVHPLMMGLEEHLIGMFRHDFEFVDGHQSHLGHSVGKTNEQENESTNISTDQNKTLPNSNEPIWTIEGKKELSKIPFFVRGKIKRNTERYARSAGCSEINEETLYDAKAHFKA